MFLIHPNRRILSTSNVPPQRRDWWAGQLHKMGSLSRIPAELVDHTVELMDDGCFPVSRKKAVEMRRKLMDKHRREDEDKTDSMMDVSLRTMDHGHPLPILLRLALQTLVSFVLQERLCYGSP